MTKRQNPNMYGVGYMLIDGHLACGNHLRGYCKSHHGLLTHGLEKIHRCRCRESNGAMCRHYIPFERYDNSYESALKGDDFRNSLGKGGARKGERKKRKLPKLGMDFVDCEVYRRKNRTEVEIAKKRLRLYMWKYGGK